MGNGITIDGVQGPGGLGADKTVIQGYDNVLSKAPTNPDTVIYKKGNTYYVMYTTTIAGQTVSAFFEHVDPNGPSIGTNVKMQGDTGDFVQNVKVYDGSSLSDNFIAESINLGKVSALPESYRNQRGFDPFELMNVQAEKFIAKWGGYLTPEYDAVLDIVFQSAIQNVEIDRQAIQDALPIGTEFNFRLLDYTNAKITGPGAMAAWEATQEETLDTVLDEYAGNFKYDNPEIYQNIKAMWTEGSIQNEAILDKIVSKMFVDTDYGDSFNEYFDSIKGDIYGSSNPTTLDFTNNLALVSDDLDNLIGGNIGQTIKEDKKKMQRWQNMYNTTDGKAKAQEEIQALWDAGAPDSLKGSNAYAQYLYFNQAMTTNQGRSMNITHEEFDNYKYLEYGDMLKKARGDGLKEGIDYTENIVKGLLNSKLGDSKYEEKF